MVQELIDEFGQEFTVEIQKQDFEGFNDIVDIVCALTDSGFRVQAFNSDCIKALANITIYANFTFHKNQSLELGLGTQAQFKNKTDISYFGFMAQLALIIHELNN